MTEKRGLKREDGFAGRGDEFYQALLEAHADLDEATSNLLNARLVLLLANHVGDIETLREALALAREDLVKPGG